jgi:hypothetical protein
MRPLGNFAGRLFTWSRAPSGQRLVRPPAWSGRSVNNLAQHLPALIAAERLTLGMATTRLEVSDGAPLDPVATAIASDPHAVSLAVALLAQIADGDPPGPPEGPVLAGVARTSGRWEVVRRPIEGL